MIDNWEDQDEVVRLTVHGQSIALYDDGSHLLAYWKNGAPYESPLLEFIYEQQYQGLVVDVGAHIGNHTIWLAGVCGLTVAAFEPLRHVELYRNIELNGLLHRVLFYRFALGDRRASAETRGTQGQLHIIPGGPIAVCTLDSAHLGPVTMMKLDVERMEPAVLRGAARTIQRDTPDLFIEEQDEEAHAEVAEILEPWGYHRERCFNRRPMGTPVAFWTFN